MHILHDIVGGVWLYIFYLLRRICFEFWKIS